MSEAENIEYEEDSLSADLAAAWDASEGSDETETSGVSEPSTESGYDSEPSEPVDSGHNDTGADKQGAVFAGEEANVRGEEAQQEGDKPPVGLSAAAREVWDQTPNEIRQEIAKREKDFAYQIQKSAEFAKKGQVIDQVVQPYQQLFAMNNASPPEMINQVLQTASVLQMGTPQQKAEMAANLIKQFGVDIKTLDNVLVGQAPPKEVQQQTEVQRAIQQAIAPYQQTMQQMQMAQQASQQQFQGEIKSEIDQFAQKAEFYQDVRLEMADILDLAANRGHDMSLEEAYNKACALNPQISKVLEQRQQQEKLAGKRNAASSVYGTPGGDGSPDVGSNLRQAIEAAWDGAGRM